MDDTRRSFLAADFVQGFINYCGFEVEALKTGQFVSRLTVRDDHRQQDGFIHAGVMASMADHTAGYASYTTVTSAYRILTIEFKINYLRPAKGNLLRCRANVIRNGRKIKVVEADVLIVSQGEETLVSKGMFTQIAVPAESLRKT